MLKRLFDLVTSLAALVFLAPVMALIALWIKWDAPGPVFFRGLRVGKDGKPFRIFKFRSMIIDADKLGPPNVSARDTRVTRVGRILRKTKLDEVPQLFNVLKGEMSMVGPRPELQIYVDLYTEAEKPILRLKPGVTDWASLVHFDQYIDFAAGDDPDRVYLEHIRPLKLQLQLLYADKCSFWTDLKILSWTVLKLVLRNEWLPPEVRPLVREHRFRAGARPAEFSAPQETSAFTKENS